jgi:RsiW-degrading membrane proteinase PrsW (M82 family)
MRWLRDTAMLAVVLLLVLIGYFVVYGLAFPLLWPHRDHPLVWVVLALLSGGHLEELLHDTGALL